MVAHGFLAATPILAEVAVPPVLPSFLAPPSLTIISAANQENNLGDLAAPILSPFSTGVLQQLRALPTYDSLTTLTYCPKGSSRRFGIIYAAAFWYQNIAMECSPLHQEFYALLAYHMPMLILHDDRPVTQLPAGAEGPIPPDAAGSAEHVSTRTKVRDRLALAEQGQWNLLVAKLAAVHREIAQRPEISHTPPSFRKTCELAFSKAAGRCFRAAAQLLTAPTAPPISIGTFNLAIRCFSPLLLSMRNAKLNGRQPSPALKISRSPHYPPSPLKLSRTGYSEYEREPSRAAAGAVTPISPMCSRRLGEPRPCTDGHRVGLMVERPAP